MEPQQLEPQQPKPPMPAPVAMALLLLRSKETLVTLGALVAVLAGGGGFAAWVVGQAQAQTVTTMSSLKEEGAQRERRVELVERAVREHVTDEAQARRQTREDVHEVQLDVRALYKYMQTRQPQARLEQPPDGGL